MYGEIAGCFARTVIFELGDVEVYAFPLDRQGTIYKKLKDVPESASTPEEIERTLRTRDEFIELVRKSAKLAIQTKSNSGGQYLLTGLQPGRRYLIIGIVPPQEDTEEYFLSVITEELKVGRQKVDIWEGSIPKEKCHP